LANIEKRENIMSLSGNLSEKFLYKIINLIQQDSDFKGILMAIAE